ncbi:excisionase family DNA binding protein [Anaerospora hongkongensis]|uniref:Excisionase family DNA binding protein n=1 Tax=Anaerospora hongkongensis TaxID=244830 RepID=A0A4R1PNC5_9FIRM|nr:helix-turn-helix domain-containing protein [Anaerospora hongkongensis]TCL32184.1 excisionase family DNA binding protein [Anaerospora hongkongensis]
MIETMYTTEEVAEILRVGVKAVYYKIQKGKLTTVREGKRHLIKESVLQAYIVANTPGMITLDEIIKNLIGMEKSDDFKEDVICAFEDYSYLGESYVYVEKQQNGDYTYYTAKVDHVNAPRITIWVEDGYVVNAYVS